MYIYNKLLSLLLKLLYLQQFCQLQDIISKSHNGGQGLLQIVALLAQTIYSTSILFEQNYVQAKVKKKSCFLVFKKNLQILTNETGIIFQLRAKGQR